MIAYGYFEHAIVIHGIAYFSCLHAIVSEMIACCSHLHAIVSEMIVCHQFHECFMYAIVVHGIAYFLCLHAIVSEMIECHQFRQFGLSSPQTINGCPQPSRVCELNPKIFPLGDIRLKVNSNVWIITSF
jgi:hypothetical protein